MSFLGFLFLVFLAYIGWKLVFGLILPVYRTTRRFKKGMREMQERMRQHAQQYGAQQSGEPLKTTAKPKSGEDYIEFEEIK